MTKTSEQFVRGDGRLTTAQRKPAKGITLDKLTTVALRERIQAQVDVLQNVIDVANGKMPDEWIRNTVHRLREIGLLDSADPDPAKRTKDLEKIVRTWVGLSTDQILDANYALLKRILPELRAVEATEETDDPNGAGMSAADIRAEIEARFVRVLEAGRAADDHMQAEEARLVDGSGEGAA